MQRRTLLLATAFALGASLGGGAPAWAQAQLKPDTTPRVPPQPGQGLGEEDARSLQRAARLSRVQTEAAGLAAERAGPDVRALAASIAKDDAQLDKMLADLAKRYKLDLAGGGQVADPSLAALHGANGDAFDRAFLARQLSLFRPMAELYQTLASNSPEPAINRYGIAALAALRGHFDTARKLGERFKLSVDTVESPPQY